MKTENCEFDLNYGCTEFFFKDNKMEKEVKHFHIHYPSCYVMFRENGAGLAKISRALKAYHHDPKHLPDEIDDCTWHIVGDPHEICIIREKLQNLRFQLL